MKIMLLFYSFSLRWRSFSRWWRFLFSPSWWAFRWRRFSVMFTAIVTRKFYLLRGGLIGLLDLLLLGDLLREWCLFSLSSLYLCPDLCLECDLEWDPLERLEVNLSIQYAAIPFFLALSCVMAVFIAIEAFYIRLACPTNILVLIIYLGGLGASFGS